jgi:hypothetical protein
MPTVAAATASTVYAMDTAGHVNERCICCGGWSPSWGATRIRIGKLVRGVNPRFGMRMANGQMDTREYICFPKTRVGHGCPTCADRYNAECLNRRGAREPFIAVNAL